MSYDNFKKYATPILRVVYSPITDDELDEKMERIFLNLSSKDKEVYLLSTTPLSKSKIFHPPPKHTCSSYNLFVKDIYNNVQMKNQDMSNIEITRKVAEMWGDLDIIAKETYKSTARTIRDTYHDEYRKWSFIDKKCVELFRMDHHDVPSPQTQWEMWVDLDITGKEAYLARATEIYISTIT